MKKRKKQITIKDFSKLYNILNIPPVEEPPVLNARIIEHSLEEVEKMEHKEKERRFWNRMIKGTGLGGKKGHDN